MRANAPKDSLHKTIPLEHHGDDARSHTRKSFLVQSWWRSPHICVRMYAKPSQLMTSPCHCYFSARLLHKLCTDCRWSACATAKPGNVFLHMARPTWIATVLRSYVAGVLAVVFANATVTCPEVYSVLFGLRSERLAVNDQRRVRLERVCHGFPSHMPGVETCLSWAWLNLFCCVAIHACNLVKARGSTHQGTRGAPPSALSTTRSWLTWQGKPWQAGWRTAVFQCCGMGVAEALGQVLCVGACRQRGDWKMAWVGMRADWKYYKEQLHLSRNSSSNDIWHLCWAPNGCVWIPCVFA